jgi:hypothetical protein
MMPAATLVFTGRFHAASFAAFARHRAGRLDLALDALETGPSAITAAVTGPAALIDAFEMACSLGPLDCLVLDVTREDHP